MRNPFQDQLLKAGLVTKQQALTAKHEKNKQNKQQRHTNSTVVDETKLKAQQVAEEKANQAREFNKKKEEQARQKAMAAEINQLIASHHIRRDASCDIAYNFEHDNKIKSIYINAELKQQIVKGIIGIACLDNRYELVPKVVAEKIQQRNEKCIVLFTNDQPVTDVSDPYANYKIPDDLMW
jgi:uncharacterized protein